VDRAGRIYVADAGNARIVRMNDMTGAGWTTLGSLGRGVKQFRNPPGVFVDGAGRIYVADQGNGRVVRINDMTGAGWTTLNTQGITRAIFVR
jgi:sugar lactone lactonase YvrE